MPQPLTLSVELPDEAGPEVLSAIRWTIENLLRPTDATISFDVKSGEAADIVYGTSRPGDQQVWIAASSVWWKKIRSGQRFAANDFTTTNVGGIDVPVLLNDGGEADLVATSFVFLSGYDEHVKRSRDRHGRYTHEGSLVQQLDILKIPVVDYIRLELLRLVSQKRRSISMSTGWGICPTVDIDYLRKWRPGIIYRELFEYPVLGRGPRGRKFGRAFRSAGQLLAQRGVYRKSLDYIRSTVESAGGQATFFFKSFARDPYDVKYPLTGWAERFIKESIDSEHEIGLHPSYWAGSDLLNLREEKALLEAVSAELHSVRSHYLKWDRQIQGNYASAGFQVDSTLGFPDAAGFRRGTCHVFELFDLDLWAPAGMLEAPLVAMDSTLFNRQDLTPKEAIAETQVLLDHAQAVSGFPVMLWHNIILDRIDCPGWDRHFEEVLQFVNENNGELRTLSQSVQRPFS